MLLSHCGPALEGKAAAVIHPTLYCSTDLIQNPLSELWSTPHSWDVIPEGGVDLGLQGVGRGGGYVRSDICRGTRKGNRGNRVICILHAFPHALVPRKSPVTMMLGCPRERAAEFSGALARIWVLFWAFGAVGSPSSPAAPHKAYTFGRSFLGLDKCNACVGTSICKKFFKDEIRFERWLSPQLMLPPVYRRWYLANYTDDSENWRPVVLSRLISQSLHEASDRSICSSAGRGHTCSIETVLRATPRFQGLGSIQPAAATHGPGHTQHRIHPA
ncbi:hypothetical protein SKAU_G00232420 [Synaphobranchus kaupii]|uniref:Uncharacterized protein n=1 Tax=Synaphobranchus kaupii TaxID=118154 RepID=A0A9Q1F5X5_SYNKA|nr:hypothetical protein SKAU_G00232420 [Synaphobranchus kaupii]